MSTNDKDSGKGPARAKDALASGTRIHWYEVRDVLGRGGFGVTYAAHDCNLAQDVAIKEYFPRGYARRRPDGRLQGTADDEESTFEWGLERFLAEARALARFRHPSIVQVFSAFEANGTAYMVMSLEHGETLLDALERGWRPDEEALLSIAHALMDGLACVHAAGFVHRDVKPTNVILRAEGDPVLVDFGAARQTLAAGGRGLTSIVTRGYAPFEQYHGNEDGSSQGPWTDIYGLGATLYRIACGRDPVDALARATEILEGGTDPLEPAARAAREGLSRELRVAIDAALAFRSDARPQSIEAWRARLPTPRGTSGRASGALRPAREVASPGTPAPASTSPAPAQPAQASVHESDRVQASRAEPEHSLADLHALIVDDERFARQVLTRMLGRLGVENAQTAHCGADALERLDADEPPPDVILADLNMPGMDGVEFLRHLADRRVRSGIVLVSGEDDRMRSVAEDLARSHRLHVLGAVGKPVQPAQLAGLLRTLDPERTDRPAGGIEPITQRELDEGLAGDAVEVFYQPQVSTRELEVVGVEALARWRHPERGLLGPGAFVPLAEETGRTEALADAVCRKAVARLGDWNADGIALGLSINFSVDSFRRAELPNEMAELASSEGVSPGQLTLEVTESGVMGDSRLPVEVLARLRLKGMRLSIDDFGTGYATMEQLKRIPFAELKIDRAFVDGATNDGSTRAILESSVMLGNRLRISLVAEGVETVEDFELVRELGCDVVQGFLFAKPMPGDEIPGWLAKWQENPGAGLVALPEAKEAG